MSKPAETAKFWVRYPSGICRVTAPWYATDDQIIHRAISLMPAFMAPSPEECTVERDERDAE